MFLKAMLMISVFLTWDKANAIQETPLEESMRTRFDGAAEKMRLAMTESNKVSFDEAIVSLRKLSKVEDYKKRLSHSIAKSFFNRSWTWYLAAVNTSPDQFFKEEFKSQFWGLLATEEWLALFNREFRIQCLNEADKTSQTKDNTQSGKCSKLAEIYQHYVEYLQQNTPEEMRKVVENKEVEETFYAIQKQHLQSEDRNVYVSRLALEPIHKAMSLYKNRTEAEYVKALDEYARVNRSLRQVISEYQNGRELLRLQQERGGNSLVKNHEKPVIQ